MMSRYTVTTHRDEKYAVVVLRVDGHYISTDWSKRVKIGKWGKLQKVISKMERKAEKLNIREELLKHDFETSIRPDK